MKVFFPETYGFCFGVKNAMNKALEIQKEKGHTIYILGDLIHNDDAIKYLKDNNILTIEKPSDVTGEVVIIRAHGESKKTYEELKGNEVYDLTCPFVKRIHDIVKEYYEKGYNIVIFGERSHPEVIGINGWCDNKGIIINSKEDATIVNNACIVEQTTFMPEKFAELLPLVKGDGTVVFKTICNHTSNAQASIIKLAKEMDSMVIVGGKKSSNTKKLFSLASLYCKNTIIVENATDLNVALLVGEKIGLGSGASTPDFVIDEVKKKIEN